jgi:hypothetical protein
MPALGAVACGRVLGMLVRLMAPGTEVEEEIDGGEVSIEVKSDPYPVTVQLLDKENFDLSEAGEEYEFHGPGLSSLNHEFSIQLDPAKSWFLLVINDTDETIAVGTEAYESDGEEDDDGDEDEEDDEDDDSEEEEDEDDDPEEDAPKG